MNDDDDDQLKRKHETKLARARTPPPLIKRGCIAYQAVSASSTRKMINLVPPLASAKPEKTIFVDVSVCGVSKRASEHPTRRSTVRCTGFGCDRRGSGQQRQQREHELDHSNHARAGCCAVCQKKGEKKQRGGTTRFAVLRTRTFVFLRQSANQSISDFLQSNRGRRCRCGAANDGRQRGSRRLAVDQCDNVAGRQSYE